MFVSTYIFAILTHFNKNYLLKNSHKGTSFFRKDKNKLKVFSLCNNTEKYMKIRIKSVPLRVLIHCTDYGLQI
jgi:hypothetical protein